MSQCDLDHSHQDTTKKLHSQKEFLPEELFGKTEQFLENENISQATLNELFHLLKKYDLAASEEQEERNAGITALLVK